MGGKPETVESRIARIAHGQHGNVTRTQLLHAGVTARQIERRLQKGLLIPEYRGVYRVGHRAPSIDARYMGAVLACGDGALLSGRPAGFIHGLLKGRPPPPEVTAPTPRSVRDVIVRVSRTIDRRDSVRIRGVPVTTVPRTLVDLAAVLTADELARACHEAGVRYRTTPAQVERVLARRPNTPGARKLRAVLRGETHVTLSKLERVFLERLRNAGMPRRYTFGDVLESPRMMLAELVELLH